MNVLGMLERAALGDGRMDISAMQLYELPASELWSKIKSLHCNHNMLSELPPLPAVEILQCCNNRLTYLSRMSSLRELQCDVNMIRELPSCPLLEVLFCSFNDLMRIPDLPKLRELICNNNKIDRLPTMRRLQRLVCHNNPMCTLPDISPYVLLYCDEDNLLYHPHYNNIIHVVRRYVVFCATIIRARRILMRRRERRWREVLAAIECRPGTGAEYHRAMVLAHSIWN